MTDYCKYHGLGNDYLVMEPARFRAAPAPAAIRAICDRHTGVGADGIMWGPVDETLADGVPPGAFAVRIYNPDGSETEKSGNGLRIFARHLWERGLARANPFTLATLDGPVSARVLDERGARVALEMGRVRFASGAVPMTGPEREAIGEPLQVGGRRLIIGAVSLGNPHCVVLLDEPPSEDLARELGPLLERHPAFPNRTNVQFLAVRGPQRIRIEIWERGAGYTAASGSSSCAAAAVAVRLGLCRSPVTVEMPGGSLEVALDEDYRAVLTGPVASVAEGRFSEEFLAATGLVRRPE